MKKTILAAVAALTALPAVASDWSGFYVGGGLSLRETTAAFPNGISRLTQADYTYPNVGTYSMEPELSHTGNTVGGHILGGYLFQKDRFVFGVEGDYEFGGAFSVYRDPGAVPTCDLPAVPFPGVFSCVGLKNFFTGIETRAHVRAVGGLEITPTLMGFLAGGLAIGKSPDTVGAQSGGIVASSPSAPLVGAAAPSRSGLSEYIYGYSIGGGIQMKAGGGLRLRAEYLYDRYPTTDFEGVSGAGFGGTIGEITTNGFTNPGDKIDIDSHSVRLSAIYQFSSRDEEIEQPAYLSESDWSGFYAGGGLSASRKSVEFPDAVNYVWSVDTTAPGVIDVTAYPASNQELDATGGHLLAGYMFQKGRFVFGIEGDYEFGNDVAYANSPGVPTSVTSGVVTTGNFSIAGTQIFFSDIETMGHIRGIAGLEVSPAMMAFAAGGVAFGKGPSEVGAKAGGLVASSPSAPLTGMDTALSAPTDDTLVGYSIGGGVQVKASRHVRLRAEYLYDRFKSVDLEPQGPGGSGAGFGGTIGELTTDAYADPGDKIDVDSHTVRLSAIYQF
jgi:opacity protein-like surface antigen